MKLYDRVTIFGQDIQVRFSEEVPDTDNANYVDNEILIHPNCPKKELSRVFLHEFFHAVFDRVSVNQGISSDAEEIIVDAISKAITENFYLRFKK